MKDVIAEEQIAAYGEKGYVAIEGFLDANELETWRRVTDQAVADRLASAEALTNQKKDDDPSYYSRVFIQCLRLADTSEEMRSLIQEEIR